MHAFLTALLPNAQSQVYDKGYETTQADSDKKTVQRANYCSFVEQNSCIVDCIMNFLSQRVRAFLTVLLPNAQSQVYDERYETTQADSDK